MKILFITTHLNVGGITSYLLNLSKGLIAREHQVFIISSGGNMEGEFESAGANVTLFNIKTKSELSPKLYFALPRIIKFIKENNIDLVHTQTRISNVLGSIIAKKIHIPFVTTCHGFFKMNLGRKLFPCWGDRVIAISPQVEEHLRTDLKVDFSRICLIHNGIDLTAFKRESEEKQVILKKQLNIGDEMIIGIVARLSDVKGINYLIEAMPIILTKIHHIKLLIVGRGKEEEYLEKMVKNLSLQDNVMFIKSENQSVSMLSIFDIFVLPSVQEGLGLSAIEAQACGIPVIATKVGGLPALIQHEKTGLLIESKNPQAIANAVLRLIADKKLCSEMVDEAKKSVAKHYSAEKMVDAVESVYTELM